jgi:D-alanyl-lipoteichoic acid acyltransferase DltB (MBOAT superfamily)
VGFVWHWIRVIFFFHLICLGWLIFRAESVAQIGEFLRAMATRFSIRGTGITEVFAFTIILLIVQVFQHWRNDLQVIGRLPALARGSVYALLVLVCLLYGEFGGAEFIYFQF